MVETTGDYWGEVEIIEVAEPAGESVGEVGFGCGAGPTRRCCDVIKSRQMW